MQKLIVSPEVFSEMILGFVKAGVTFEAVENQQGNIEVKFTGGY